MRPSTILLLIIFFASCNSKTKSDYQTLNKKIDLRNDNFLNSFGIYALDQEKLITKKEFDYLISERLPHYKKYKIRNERRNELGYYIDKIDFLEGVLTPPKLDYLSQYGYGITPLQKKQLTDAKNIFVITFYGSNESVKREQEQIQKFIHMISTDKQYVIVDFGTLEYFTPKSWEERRLNNYKMIPYDIANQVLIKINKTDKNKCRAITFGMGKFCLPDISISNFTCDEYNKYRNLLKFVAQRLSENYTIGKDSTLAINLKDIKNKKWNSHYSSIENSLDKVETIKLGLATLKNGDKYNQQLEILKSEKGVEIEVLINQLFNYNEVNYVSHTGKILEISKKARKKLPELKHSFNTKTLVDNFLLVKAPFIVKDKKREWMWVKIKEWNDDSTIKGVLYNSSKNSTYLKEGVIISIHEKDIFDYIYKDKNGHYIGNETEKYLVQ